MKLIDLQQNYNELVNERLINYNASAWQNRSGDTFFDSTTPELMEIWFGNTEFSFSNLKRIGNTNCLTEKQLIKAVQKEEVCIAKLEQIFTSHQLTKEVN